MADYNSKYSGEQVEALLDQVASGNAGGGGGGITVETDPIFSASPAASITEQKIAEWDAKSEQGPQGDKGDKGDKGDTGVGVQSVAQTTTSDADGGSNVVTVTLTDGTKSTFTVKNGSKGSQGIQGEQGPKGDTGATGAQGPKGDKGDKGDTGATGANGTNGVSVSSVRQTTTSSADGGTNVVTVILSNGTTSTFNVKNGSKGSNGTNGKDGADGATFTPSVDSAGNLSWTNDKGLTNPPTVNIKGPKGDAGEGGGSSGGSKEVIVDNSSNVQINNALPNKIYILSSWEIYTIEITSFTEETAYDEYTFIFRYPYGLSLPSDVVFANEMPPIVGADTLCELSIVGITIGSHRRYNAVLTTFGYL